MDLKILVQKALKGSFWTAGTASATKNRLIRTQAGQPPKNLRHAKYFMRTVFNPQMELGQIAIADIKLDPKSRDDIPQLLRGLQHLHADPGLRERVFAILGEMLPERVGAEGKASPKTGRPGLAQWRILVLGVLRLGLNADYDRIQELANQHATLRLMLGHGDWADESYYELQTLKDNLTLFTPDILDRVNQEVVRAGHKALKKSPGEGLNARADSFVVETNVEYPTDTGLLYDAVRKALGLCAELSAAHKLPGWRQDAHLLRKFKQARRRIQQLRHSTAKDEQKRQDRGEEIKQAHRDYLERAETLVARMRATRNQLAALPAIPLRLAALDGYLKHAGRQVDQIGCWRARRSPTPRRSSPFSSRTPNGSSRARPGCRLNWGCGCAWSKTSTASSSTTRSWRKPPTTRLPCRSPHKPSGASRPWTPSATTRASTARPTSPH